jgi:hypothetical protein
MFSRPYRNNYIITVIRNLYFNGPDSFVDRFGEHFPLHHKNDGSTSYEVPVPMVALVGTGVSHAFIMHISGGLIQSSYLLPYMSGVWARTRWLNFQPIHTWMFISAILVLWSVSGQNEKVLSMP